MNEWMNEWMNELDLFQWKVVSGSLVFWTIDWSLYHCWQPRIRRRMNVKWSDLLTYIQNLDTECVYSMKITSFLFRLADQSSNKQVLLANRN